LRLSTGKLSTWCGFQGSSLMTLLPLAKAA